jgi:8-oxo-dGTP pyrophosphatase MutT (NUDIX family)
VFCFCKGMLFKPNRFLLQGILLRGKRDIFHGMTVDLSSNVKDTTEKNPIFSSVNEFYSSLKYSMQYWKKNENIRGVWLKIPIEHSQLITAAVSNGFVFHHAEPGFVMMTNWLPDPSKDPNKLPKFAQHFVGCGGVCIDLEKREILLVTERTKFREESEIMWKIPGGACDNPDETIGEAAIREVWEETGVKSEFLGVLGFRHTHNYRFGKSDLYFVCVLKPLTREINMDGHEIEFCQWMPLEQYFKFTHLYKVQMSVMRCVQNYMKDPTMKLGFLDISQFGRKSTMYVLPGTVEE